MSLRQKILLMFSVTILLTVTAVAWTVSGRVRNLFESLNRDRTAALVDESLHEYQRRGADVAQRVERTSHDERVTRIAYDLAHGGDPALYLTDASSLAQEYRLDFLELVQADGAIVSSAQWPAHFGYRDVEAISAGKSPFLKREMLTDDRAEIGIFSEQTAGVGSELILIGGERLDSAFVANLSAPAGSVIYLYRNATQMFDAENLVDANGNVSDATPYRDSLEQVRTTGLQLSRRITRSDTDSESFDLTAVPLKAQDGSVAAVLLVANSRAALVEAQQHIRSVAYGVAAVGVLFAVLVSLWIAASVSRPVEQLAEAAREIGAGDWSVEVPVRSDDEIGQLGIAFNSMAKELVHQRERLVQSERVAAWRELARRLAHELKNPLFPLQLTVDNMVRAKTVSPEMFEEVFAEGVTALREEIANLKNIVGRFSNFSKMPKPQLGLLDLREIIERIVRLYQPALSERACPIKLIAEIPDTALSMSADAELLHRALSNLVLNAMDAMPAGGTLRITASRAVGLLRLTVSDTGEGMTTEECSRLFTPYYTTREYGTGLGLAIVQSVVADHYGTISVESTPGLGTTFTIELPAGDITAGGLL